MAQTHRRPRTASAPPGLRAVPADPAGRRGVPVPRGADAPARRPLAGRRIALVNWRDPWQSVAGGAEEYAWRMARHLTGQGAEVVFVTSRERGQPARERRAGVSFRRMGGAYTVYPLVLLWLLRHRRRFDAVVDCMNGIPFFSPLVLPRRTPVVSVVHHVHDLQFNAYFSRPVAWLGRFIEGPVASRLYRRCTTVTVSESSRRALRAKLGWRAPITVIRNGAPAVQRLDTAAPPADLGSPALVSLGRLVVQKRVVRIVDAAAELSGDWPGLRVHVIGRGPESVPLRERIAEHGLGGRVRMHGFLPEREKNTLLSRCLLHVTASEFEGWGLTVIEAAALGVPTVAYDVDGLRDSVWDGVTGWLVREGETLSEVVGRALAELADPVRAAAVRQACRDWAKRFTWERSGREMTTLLAAEIAGRERPGRSRAGRSRGAPG
ncbi:glycosyltransferase family 4 protein [Allonocardiopsis opalescens]|uniref:Glycosyltransferase involved in cell wall biosynthesis n=1 Tax=Allonocardiopsis opalescens TaxID=1144618 RepID=A0A2T0QCI6_9ACTN|nr:glycosyltransferase family 4 protein [Allonocardiopsis opalescens]PRY01580.1 glycosyltransferase involved in cell wall biosynthesis [Allonocardiopsis opalescens]